MFYFYWKFFFSRKFFSLFFHRKHKNRMAVWVCVCVHWPMHSNVRLSGRWSYTSNTQFYVLNAKKWIHRIILQIYALAMPKCVSLFFCLSAKYAVAVPSIAYYVYVGVNCQSNESWKLPNNIMRRIFERSTQTRLCTSIKCTKSLRTFPSSTVQSCWYAKAKATKLNECTWVAKNNADKQLVCLHVKLFPVISNIF